MRPPVTAAALIRNGSEPVTTFAALALHASSEAQDCESRRSARNSFVEALKRGCTPSGVCISV